MSLFDLSGKTVIITGGGSGIGKGISLLFGQQGARVYILEMNLDASLLLANAVSGFYVSSGNSPSVAALLEYLAAE